MKLILPILSTIALTAMLVTTTPSSYAASEVQTPGDIGVTVNPNASGTKVNGFLTISYDTFNGTDPHCAAFGFVSANITVVLNLNWATR